LDPSILELDQEKEDFLGIDEVDWDNNLSPFQFAVFFGEIECAALLLDADADINLTTTNGRTALHLTLLSKGNPEIFQFLLERGANINQLDDGRNNILHLAVANYPDFVKLIVGWKGPEKVNINARNSQQHTPLQCVLQQIKPKDYSKDPVDNITFEMITVLVEGGAKVEYDASDLPSIVEDQVYRRRRVYSEGDPETEKVRKQFEQPIFMATQIGSEKLIRYFLEKGANPNWINSDYYQRSTPFDSLERRIVQLEGISVIFAKTNPNF
jgi:ankyrin repeat protein